MKTAEEILIEVYSAGESENKRNFLKLVDYSESKTIIAMKEYAQQESEKAVNDCKERLIKDSDDYVEVFTLLRNVKYQTEKEETQEYKMCFEMDLPKIIKGYLIEKLK